jgi:thiol-disulfide isomerase/thioredoxin
VSRTAPTRRWWLPGLPLLLVAVLLATLPASAGETVDLVAWTGGPTPPLRLKGLDGQSYDLTQQRGKALVINFWATWCPPCREELPTLARLRETLRDLPIEIVTVNVAEGENRVKQFVANMSLQLPVLLDRNAEAQHDWKVRGLPATFVLDPDGAIRYWYLGELDWSQPNIQHTVESVIPRTR